MTAPSPDFLNKDNALELLRNWFDYFQNCCNRSQTINANDLAKFLAPHFQISSNGQLIGTSLLDYLQRMLKMDRYYCRAIISKPLQEPLVSGNQVVIYYTVDLTARNGQNSQMIIMAIATIENNRISRWTQVAHERGTGHWETMNP